MRIAHILEPLAVATTYDAVNAVIFFPSGGSRRLRQSLVDALDIRSGHRVLELGCGTGQVTARLLAAGAEVVAVDALSTMLAAARRRAPGASFREGDALHIDVGGGYDRVVLSFVLHNFAEEERIRLLRRAVAALAPGGRVGVLEWALPAQHIRGSLWRKFLHQLEPSAAVHQILDGALDRDLPAARLRVEHHRDVAGGRAQILVATASD